MKFRWLVLLLCAFATRGFAAELNAITVPVKPVKVSAHCYYVQGMPGAASSANQGFMSNAGFVVTKEGVVVIDSLGSPPLGQELIRQIRKITHQPIKRVVVTHYHADHVYGLQPLKAIGAEIWAHKNGQIYLASDVASTRLAQRREELFPWVDEKTRVLSADKWLDGDTEFEMGGVHFALRYVGPAHSPEDMAILVREDGVLYAGDLVFKGRVPYVGEADSRSWLAALNMLLAMEPKIMIPGHGGVSTNAAQDLALTRDYLAYVRESMGNAVQNLVPFDEAYANTSWKQFEKLPAFNEANRVNAYNTYLLLEKESLK